ncbi:cobalt-zinc-cadmium efflux system protein [Kineosphaera limosa]|uniref:Putative cation efflux protein n=1 Tax=Kineosphaera limosa NBRC 100340 TaxID=1184609 RepID=K6VGC6_9MICO|nr:cobalt-zinc-cadmium efflux system protein [Kineosphaera limosa]GAB95233.1 putative cation efflux protein [Kineosphaera limosa NBRC 100340]
MSGHTHAHGHKHGHTHGHTVTAAGRHRWRLAVAFGLVATFFVVELVAGIVANSLALISDAGHMAADVVTLGAALVATRIATRPDTTGRRTFGSYRAEVFASGFAVLVMLGVAVFITVEAIGRIGAAVDPAYEIMLVVGTLGLVVNLMCLALLRAGSKESLNVKGAYLEVLADTLGSVGVIVAALLVRATGSAWWDTAIALAIAIFVAVRALFLGREVLAVLGQHAPAGLDPRQLGVELERVAGVIEVHDLHVWQLTSGMNVATAHLVVAPDCKEDALGQASALLRERFDIEHATLQVESTPESECGGATW